MQGLLLSRQGLCKETKIHKSEYVQWLLIKIEPQYQEFAVGIGSTTNVQVPPSFFGIHVHVTLKYAVTQKQAEPHRTYTILWESLARQNYSPVLPVFE